jgi:hypothetical protein
MAYQFKSKTLQAIQAKREQQAREVVTGIAADFNRVKQKVEELYGERGQNSAVRRQELAAAATVKLKSAAIGFGGEVTINDFNNLRADVENLYKLLAQIANKPK